MSNDEALAKKVRTRWIVFWVGIVIILLGVALMWFAPQLFLQLRWEIVFFFIPTGWAAAELAKLSAIRKSPEAALREKVQNTDERMISLRMHAGNTAFFITLALSIIALLVYSFVSKAQNAGLDWTWNYLAFMVVIPLVVYVMALIYYNARN